MEPVAYGDSRESEAAVESHARVDVAARLRNMWS
jgi:hypothetical protein